MPFTINLCSACIQRRFYDRKLEGTRPPVSLWQDWVSFRTDELTTNALFGWVRRQLFVVDELGRGQSLLDVDVQVADLEDAWGTVVDEMIEKRAAQSLKIEDTFYDGLARWICRRVVDLYRKDIRNVEEPVSPDVVTGDRSALDWLLTLEIREAIESEGFREYLRRSGASGSAIVRAFLAASAGERDVGELYELLRHQKGQTLDGMPIQAHHKFRLKKAIEKFLVDGGLAG